MTKLDDLKAEVRATRVYGEDEWLYVEFMEMVFALSAPRAGDSA